MWPLGTRPHPWQDCSCPANPNPMLPPLCLQPALRFSAPEGRQGLGVRVGEWAWGQQGPCPPGPPPPKIPWHQDSHSAGSPHPQAGTVSLRGAKESSRFEGESRETPLLGPEP